MTTNTSPVRRYRVKRGDTLEAIARRFQSAPQTIALMNAWKGLVPSRVTTWDFRPGTLRVGDFLFVPARGAGAPGVAPRRPRGRRPPRRAARGASRVRGLGDEFCGDGYELSEDFWGNVECVWVGSDDWSEDEYIDDEDNTGDEDWKSYLSIPEVASALNAYNSGQTGEGFANSLSAGQRAAMAGVCSLLIWLATITTIIGGFFVQALCTALENLANKPDAGTPGSDEQYPLDCGNNYWQHGPGQPCIYAASGEPCSDMSESFGYFRGFFNDDGDCIYNDAETSKSTPKSVCDYLGGPPGSNGWRQPGAGWFCLLPCDKDENFDASDGTCVCKAGLKRDANMKCVKAGGGGPVTPQPVKPQPVKPQPGKPDKPQPPNKPTVEKTEGSNAPYYVAAAFFVGLAVYFGTKKKK